MSLIAQVNSNLNQSGNLLFTCPIPGAAGAVLPALDRNSQVAGAGNLSLCSRVSDCALMPFVRSVAAAALSLVQSVGRGKTALSSTEFMTGIHDQKDDASLIRFILSHKNVEISDAAKHAIIVGTHSVYHRLSDRTAQFLIKRLKPTIDFISFVTWSIAYASSAKFLEWLYKQGIPSNWYHMLTSSGSTILQTMAGRGHIELVQKIAKDMPQDKVKLASNEEMQDCLIQREPVDLSRFDFHKTLVAQNGCRAAVMTPEGEVHSYPGQDASQLAQQMANGADIDSFTIYHNAGHASIAFSDAHFGFYPGNNLNKADMGADETFQNALARQGRGVVGAQFSTMSSGTLGMQSGSSSVTDSYKSKTAMIAPGHIWALNNLHTQADFQPCAVIDDSKEQKKSHLTNGLVLKVYAPKDKVEAIRQYVINMQNACAAGGTAALYHVLTNNCIDFVRQAVQASGTQADFRDSFHTMQYLRRPGFANIYTLLRSNQPMLHTNSSLLGASSLPEAVDRVSRNAVLAPFLSPYVYLVYKGIPKAIAAGFRASSRIQRAAMAIAGYVAAMGAFFQRNVLRRNG